MIGEGSAGRVVDVFAVTGCFDVLCSTSSPRRSRRHLTYRAFAQYIRAGRWKLPITPSRRPYLRVIRV